MAAPPPTAPADDTSPPVSLSAQLKDLDSRFWIVNTMEMFERLAYYGVRTVVPLYMVLSREEGGPELSHEQKGVIFAWWAGMQSVLPMFTGGYADRYGHKQTIAAAIVLKIIGYLMMAELKSYGGFFAGCMLLAAGTAIFKPGVQGTLAATLKKSSASVGWGVFYQLVNVGGFIGPVLAGVLRLMDWRYVFWSCAVIVAINFLWLPFYRDSTQDAAHDPNPPSPLQVLITSVTGLFRPRVFFFCVVFSGFWLMFNQVFDLLPNMIDDWVDSSDIIKTVGAAFSTSAVPIALALALGAMWGGVCWAVSWLGTRPDHHPASEVSRPAWVVAGLAVGLALTLPLPMFTAISGLYSLALFPVISLVAAVALATLRPATGPLAMVVGAVGGVLGAVGMQRTFAASAPELVAMAQRGEQVPPEWLLNANAGLIVFTMVFFGYLTSFVRPLTSILAGMAVATVGSYMAGTSGVGWGCLVGILVFSAGEMLSSPKKMEYLATLSPKGQEGLFMGYANIPVAIGWIVGSLYAGSRYETDGDKANLARRMLTERFDVSAEAAEAIPRSEVVAQLAQRLNDTPDGVRRLLYETYHPEAIWTDIALIGVVSMVGMFVYDRVLRVIDARAAGKGA